MIGDDDGLADAGFRGSRSSENVEVFADALRIGQQTTHIHGVAVFGSQRLYGSDEIARRPARRRHLVWGQGPRPRGGSRVRWRGRRRRNRHDSAVCLRMAVTASTWRG